MGEDPPTAEVAYLKLQSSLDVGLTRIQGQLDLLLQRQDQSDQRQRAAEQKATALEERVREVERTKVSTDELDARTKRLWVILGGLMTAIGTTVAVISVMT